MLRDITWQRASLPGWPACPLTASAALVASVAFDVVAGVVSLRLGAIVALLALFGSAPLFALAEGGTREKETQRVSTWGCPQVSPRWLPPYHPS